MAHPYFQEDDFVNNFEIELKRIIDEEKEKESIDRNKRRKHKKVSFNYVDRSSRVQMASLIVNQEVR